jgi:hypothetical protein
MSPKYKIATGRKTPISTPGMADNNASQANVEGRKQPDMGANDEKADKSTNQLEQDWKQKTLLVKCKVADWFLKSFASIQPTQKPRELHDVLRATVAFFELTGQDMKGIEELTDNKRLLDLVSSISGSVPSAEQPDESADSRDDNPPRE